jgi:hypothetical protein
MQHNLLSRSYYRFLVEAVDGPTISLYAEIEPGHFQAIENIAKAHLENPDIISSWECRRRGIPMGTT